MTTSQQWEGELGRQIRTLRLRQNLDQQQLAERAGIALNAVKNLESGKGSTLRSMISSLLSSAASVADARLPLPVLPRPPRTSEPTTSTAMSAAMTARSVRLVDVGPAHPVMPPNCPPVMCSTWP